MQCRKCGSRDINIQMVTKTKTKRKGILYWVFIGWWFEIIMWIFLTLPWLIIKIFKPKKTKSKMYKMAICQNCGNSWRV